MEGETDRRIRFPAAVSRKNCDHVPAADRAADARLASGGRANPRLPATPICASVPLLNWVSPFQRE